MGRWAWLHWYILWNYCNSFNTKQALRRNGNFSYLCVPQEAQDWCSNCIWPQNPHHWRARVLTWWWLEWLLQGRLQRNTTKYAWWAKREMCKYIVFCGCQSCQQCWRFLHTGIIMSYVQNAPILWISKQQKLLNPHVLVANLSLYKQQRVWSRLWGKNSAACSVFPSMDRQTSFVIVLASQRIQQPQNPCWWRSTT